jgi:hypothetical protein
MAHLLLSHRPVKTVFHLLGQKENDITYSIGWGLAQCETFALGFIHNLFPSHKSGKIQTVELQKYEKQGGFTDIEIVADHTHVIIEAKRGWQLSGKEKLKKYRGRFRDTSK